MVIRSGMAVPRTFQRRSWTFVAVCGDAILENAFSSQFALQIEPDSRRRELRWRRTGAPAAGPGLR